VDVFQKQCFLVFSGVLWCFAVFCVRVFLAFRVFSQNSTKQDKNITKPKRTKTTKYALFNTAQ